MCRHTPLTPVLGGRDRYISEFKDILHYTESSRIPRATLWDSVWTAPPPSPKRKTGTDAWCWSRTKTVHQASQKLWWWPLTFLPMTNIDFNGLKHIKSKVLIHKIRFETGENSKRNMEGGFSFYVLYPFLLDQNTQGTVSTACQAQCTTDKTLLSG